MARTTIWAAVAEAPQMPLASLSEHDRAIFYRTYFIGSVLFGIKHNVKLPEDGNPGVTFHALWLDLSEETVRKMEDLIWESEIRDKTSEFACFTIKLCINQFKALVAPWDDLVAEASG